MKDVSTILLLKAVQPDSDANKKIEVHLSLNYVCCPAKNSSIILECEHTSYRFVVKDALHCVPSCFGEEPQITIISDIMCDSEYDLINTYEEIRSAYNWAIIESPANFNMPDWYRLYRWILDNNEDLHKTIVYLQEVAGCMWWDNECLRRTVVLHAKEDLIKSTHNVIEALTIDVDKFSDEDLLHDAINSIVS